jgi:hypothetical protein
VYFVLGVQMQKPGVADVLYFWGYDNSLQPRVRGFTPHHVEEAWVFCSWVLLMILVLQLVLGLGNNPSSMKIAYRVCAFLFGFISLLTTVSLIAVLSLNESYVRKLKGVADEVRACCLIEYWVELTSGTNDCVF